MMVLKYVYEMDGMLRIPLAKFMESHPLFKGMSIDQIVSALDGDIDRGQKDIDRRLRVDESKSMIWVIGGHSTVVEDAIRTEPSADWKVVELGSEDPLEYRHATDAIRCVREGGLKSMGRGYVNLMCGNKHKRDGCRYMIWIDIRIAINQGLVFYDAGTEIAYCEGPIPISAFDRVQERDSGGEWHDITDAFKGPLTEAWLGSL
jgi:hypothetical protein